MLPGSDAIGHWAIGHPPTNTNIVLPALAGSFALTGTAQVFKVSEAAVAGGYALTGTAQAFKLSEAAASGAFAETGVAAPLVLALNPVSGAFTLTGMAETDSQVWSVSAGAFAITSGNNQLLRTGADFDLVYGGIGHYLEEMQRTRDLAKITRKTPQPIRFQPRQPFASPMPVARPQIAPQFQAPDAQAIQNQRMAAQQSAAQAATAKRRRQEMEIMLLCC